MDPVTGANADDRGLEFLRRRRRVTPATKQETEIKSKHF